MRITFETDAVTGEWMCVLWDKEGNMLYVEYGASALAAENKMKKSLMSLFPH